MDHLNFFQIANNCYLDKYGEEDLLTDLLATFLQLDSQAACAWFERLSGIDPNQIVITPQPPFRDYPHDAPDFLLESAEMNLICEHKIGSPIGDQQLERYLALTKTEEARTHKPHRLALVTKNDNYPIPATILDDPHYARPSNSRHFRWQDFYRVLQELADKPESTHPAIKGLREQFLQHLTKINLATIKIPEGFVPVTSHNTEEEKAIQRAFGEQWRQTIDSFAGKGYRWNRGSRVQLFIWPTAYSEIPDHSGITHMMAEPTEGNDLPHSAGFLPPVLEFNVHLEPSHEVLAANLVARQRFNLDYLKLPVAVTRRKQPNSRIRISFAVPLNPLFENANLPNALFAVITELYTQVIHPEWFNVKE